MPAFSFQAQFIKAIETGEKSQTIRALRKDGGKPCHIGDTLYLYTGMRTKSCRKLREVICTSVRRIHLSAGSRVWIASPAYRVPSDWRFIDTRLLTPCLTPTQTENLAMADGFENALALHRWFDKTHNLPFDGWVIKWASEEGCE